MTDSAATVRDNTEESRFEIRTGDELAGIAVYRITDDRIVFTHTEIEDEHEGEGLGSKLIKAALDDVRAAGHQVVPVCPFVASYIERHQEYAELVDDEMTARLAH